MLPHTHTHTHTDLQSETIVPSNNNVVAEISSSIPNTQVISDANYHGHQSISLVSDATKVDSNFVIEYRETQNAPKLEQKKLNQLTEDVFSGDIFSDESMGSKRDLIAGPTSRSLLSGSGQSPNYVKVFGNGGQDNFYSVQQTSDGGYIVAGLFSGQDALILKLDDSMLPSWVKKYGDADYQSFSMVQQTSEQGYIATGSSYSSDNGYYNVLITKFSSLYAVGWSRMYGVTGGHTNANSVQQLTTGEYIISGWSSSGILVLKLYDVGNINWAKVFGGGGNDKGIYILPTSDAGYIIAGYSSSLGAGNTDALAFKLTSSGVKSWAKVFGGSNRDEVYAVQTSSDGGYIFCGLTNSVGSGGFDILIIKLDSSGNNIWIKTFGGTGDEHADQKSCLKQTSDGGYIIAGYTVSVGSGAEDCLIIKIDDSGNKVWAKVFGSTGEDYCTSVQQTSDGGYVIVGYTNSLGAGNYDGLIVKLDEDGKCKYNCFGEQVVTWNTLNVTLTETSVPWTVQDKTLTSYDTGVLQLQDWTPTVTPVCYQTTPTVNVPINSQTNCCTIGIGQPYGLTGFTFVSNTFTDIDGDTLNYAATKYDGSALPSWLTFTPGTKTFSGTPNSASLIGNLVLNVTATDPSSAKATDTFTLTITKTLTATNTNAALAYTEDSNQDFTDIVVSTPASNINARMKLNNLAVGSLGNSGTGTSGSVIATYDSNSGVWEASGAKADVNTLLSTLRYQPKLYFHNPFTISVNITDEFGQQVLDAISAVGTHINHAPYVFNAITGQTNCCSASVGNPYIFNFADNTFAEHDDEDTISYTATKSDDSARPSWLNFNSGTRTLSGTPDNANQIGSLAIKGNRPRNDALVVAA